MITVFIVFKIIFLFVNKQFLVKVFNFDEVLNNSEKDVGKNWKSITEKDPEANKTFPIIDSANIEKLRSAIKEDLSLYMKDNYPSLKKDL